MKSTFRAALIMLFLIVWVSSVFAQEKMSVAVLDFVGKNVSQEDAQILAEFFRSNLIKTGAFDVLDRHHLQKILDEQHFQGSGTTDVKNAVQIGRLANTQAVFVGTYSRLDTLFALNIEMINVQTGKIEKSLNRSVDNPKPKDKLDLARYLAYSLIGFGVGYELFWNGNRVGFEPERSREEAERNLAWNRKTYPGKKVDGYFNGQKMP
jgi:hypothetical protein